MEVEIADETEAQAANRTTEAAAKTTATPKKRSTFITFTPIPSMASTDEDRLSVFTKQTSQSATGKCFHQDIWCSATMTFSTVVCILSTVVCGLAFAVLPNRNPLHADDGSHWWHCALACAAVWSPLTVFYIRELLQGFLYAPYDQKMDLKTVFFLYLSFALSMVAAMALTLGVWLNPSPLNGVTATLSALIGASFFMFLYIVPHLSSEYEQQRTSTSAARIEDIRNSIRDLKWKGFLVIMFSLSSAVVLMAMLVWSSFLMWMDIWYVSIMGIGAFRTVGCFIFERLAMQFNEEAKIVGVNLVMASTGMANVISIGSSGTWSYAATLMFIDIVYILKRVGSLTGLEIGGVSVSEILLDVPRFLKGAVMHKSVQKLERIDPITLRALYQKQLSYLIAQEAGEIAVPVAYLSCWLVVLAGPSRGSFSGTGTKDFGLVPPEDLRKFLMMSGFLVAANYFSVVFLRCLVRSACKIDLEHEARKLFQAFGGILIAQTAWIVVTAFCMTMIQCGLDYSLQYDYLR